MLIEILSSIAFILLFLLGLALMLAGVALLVLTTVRMTNVARTFIPPGGLLPSKK